MKIAIKIFFLGIFSILIGCREDIDLENLPSQFTARVVRVKDGDSMEILYKKYNIEVRLHHIDCPEKNQPYSNNAKQFTSNLVLRKRVIVYSNGGIDRFDRLVAEIVTTDSINLNKALVVNGLAMHFKRFSKDQEYHNLELQAKESRVGMWKQTNPIPPWEFRDSERKREKALY